MYSQIFINRVQGNDVVHMKLQQKPWRIEQNLNTSIPCIIQTHHAGLIKQVFPIKIKW